MNMRKVGIVVGIIVAVIVIAVVVVLAVFNPNDYKATIQTKLEQQLGRKVSLGDMSLGIFPLRFKVANLSIADDPKFSTEPFIQTQLLSVSVKLLPLLSKSVEVDSLSLERPNVNLIRNAQGVWNFASLGQTQAPEAAARLQSRLRRHQVSRRPLQRRPRRVNSNFRWANWLLTTDKLRLPICRIRGLRRYTTTSISNSPTSRPLRLSTSRRRCIYRGPEIKKLG